MRRFMLLVCWVFGLAALWSGPAAANPGERIRHADFASEHVMPRHVEVWLPEGYAAGEKRYHVLYMHDGQNLFALADSNFNKVWAADEHVTRLVREGRLQDTIVVGIWSTPARFREYAPAGILDRLPPELQAQAPKHAGGSNLSDAYLRFLVEELKPFIDRTYRTMPGREHTFIMGSSMGGLISLYAVTRYPDVFGGAGCLSTHWPLVVPGRASVWEETEWRRAIIAAELDFIADSPLDPAAHRIYFDYGTATLDALYEPYQQRVDQGMEAKGFRFGENWVTRRYPDAPHEENAWNARMDDPLLFLLGR